MRPLHVSTLPSLAQLTVIVQVILISLQDASTELKAPYPGRSLLVVVFCVLLRRLAPSCKVVGGGQQLSSHCAEIICDVY